VGAASKYTENNNIGGVKNWVRGFRYSVEFRGSGEATVAKIVWYVGKSTLTRTEAGI